MLAEDHQGLVIAQPSSETRQDGGTDCAPCSADYLPTGCGTRFVCRGLPWGSEMEIDNHVTLKSIVGEMNDEGQDAPSRVEMGNSVLNS